MRMEAPPPPSSPWQLLYGGAHRLRGRWYRSRARRLPRPVVSVGNLHWGGTGKTPLVAAVAGHLVARGLRVCILSRGYGSHGTGVRVVSTGEGPLLGVSEAGDEPVLLAGRLPGVAVVVGPDRHEAGSEALRRLAPAPEIFLLDDGFSHLALHRDLDLLAFPAADPFGGGRLLPSGRLREPLAAVARASAVVLTGVPATAEGAGAALALALRPHGFAGPGFASETRPEMPRRVGAAERARASGKAALPGSASGSGRAEDPPDTLPAPGGRVLLVTAIARPERFTATVAGMGFEIAGEVRFPDHHPYPPPSLARIEAAFRASGAAAVLTTSKDAVKLAGRLGVPLGELPVRAEPEPAFWLWLDGWLDRAGRGGASGGALQPGSAGPAAPAMRGGIHGPLP